MSALLIIYWMYIVGAIVLTLGIYKFFDIFLCWVKNLINEITW
jgi:hypothetical protein